MRLRNAIGIAMGLVVGAPPLALQAKTVESPLVRAFADCQRQEIDAARLRCMDAAAAALTAATSAGKVILVEQEDVRRARRSLFGFSVPKLPFFSGDRSADDQKEELTARIAAAGSLGHGKYRIRLEDGALWETTEGWPTLRNPRSGDEVLIKRGTLGGYMIRIAGQRALRAKRVG